MATRSTAPRPYVSFAASQAGRQRWLAQAGNVPRAALVTLQFVACGTGSQAGLPDTQAGSGSGETAIVEPASRGAATEPAAAHPSRAAEVEPLLRPLLDGGWIPGLAIALCDGDELELLSYGRVRPGGPAIDPDTLFEIGSLTKVFTAALLQDMIERGETGLDDKVASLLPPGTKLPSGGGDQIALRDLATHHSGLPRLPDDVAALDDANPYADYDVDRMYDFLARAALAQPPGQSYEYSNLGFALLGDALARRAGGDYARLVLDRVVAALDMHDSWFSVPQAERARLAQGQNADGEVRGPWDLAAFTPAGGIVSSARDMARLLSAALAQPDAAPGGLLSATMTPQREIPGGQIGLAWQIMPDGLVWHNGETGGYHSFVGIDRGQRVAAMLLSASAGVVVDRLGMALIDLMRGRHPTPLDVPVTMDIDPNALDEYAGRYPLGSDFAIELWRDGEILRGQATDQPAFRLWPLLTDLFYLRVVEAQIDFQRDLDGKVVSLILHQGGATQRAFREQPTHSQRADDP